jgi:hypothetical protein
LSRCIAFRYCLARSGPSGAVPVTAMTLPLRTAREIPTLGSNGDPVETCWRDGRLMLRVLASHNY